MKKTIKSTGGKFVARYRETTRRGEVLHIRHDILMNQDDSQHLIGRASKSGFALVVDNFVPFDPIYFDELKHLILEVNKEHQTTQQ